VLEPIGGTQEVWDDEVLASLRYVAALGAGFGLTQGSTQQGRLGIRATTPDAAFVVDVTDRVDVRAAGADEVADADLVLAGDAVDLLEALSRRRPLPHAVPGDAAWLVSGLATVFDQA
jgi:hypothetical protein